MQKRHLGPRPVFCQFPSAEMAACAHLIQISTEETSKENVGKIISLQQFAIKLLSDKILNVKCDEGTPASIPSMTCIFKKNPEILSKDYVHHDLLIIIPWSTTLPPPGNISFIPVRDNFCRVSPAPMEIAVTIFINSIPFSHFPFYSCISLRPSVKLLPLLSLLPPF